MIEKWWPAEEKKGDLTKGEEIFFPKAGVDVGSLLLIKMFSGILDQDQTSQRL